MPHQRAPQEHLRYINSLDKAERKDAWVGMDLHFDSSDFTALRILLNSKCFTHRVHSFLDLDDMLLQLVRIFDASLA